MPSAYREMSLPQSGHLRCVRTVGVLFMGLTIPSIRLIVNTVYSALIFAEDPISLRSYVR